MTCPDPNSFETIPIYSSTTHLLSIIVIPSSSFCLFLILCKTPTYMANMKRVLFNVHLWITICDIMIGTMTVPYVYFPAIAGWPLGVLTYFEVDAFLQTYVTINCICYVGASIALTFENRHFHLVKSSKYKITNKHLRWSIIFINYIYPPIFQIPIFWNIPDQEIAKSELQKEIPCLTPDFFSLPVIIISSDLYMGFFMGFSVLLYGVQALFYIIHSMNYLYSGIKNVSTSAKTKKMERKYYYSVCVQMLIPLSIVIVPVYYFAISVLTSYYNQVLNNIGFLILSIHGFFGTLGLILTNKDYRAYTANLMTPTCKNAHKRSRVSCITNSGQNELRGIRLPSII